MDRYMRERETERKGMGPPRETARLCPAGSLQPGGGGETACTDKNIQTHTQHTHSRTCTTHTRSPSTPVELLIGGRAKWGKGGEHSPRLDCWDYHKCSRQSSTQHSTQHSLLTRQHTQRMHIHWTSAQTTRSPPRPSITELVILLVKDVLRLIL